MISPRTILVPVSFSGASRAALVLAATVARHARARLHVLHVEDRFLRAGATHAGFDLRDASRVQLRRLIRDAWPAPECSPEMHVAAGTEVAVILDVAHDTGADLIVVGSRERSAVERLFFGSTAERLLRRSDVSVLVAPADWEPPDPLFERSGCGRTVPDILGSCVRVVRGVNGSSPRPIAYRALSAAAMPILLQVVESVLGS